MTQTTLPPVEKTQPVSSPRGGFSARSRAERKLGWLLAGPAFVVMLLVTAYPIVQAVSTRCSTTGSPTRGTGRSTG